MAKRVFVKEGDRFGRLTVIRELKKPVSLINSHHRLIELRCDCGQEISALLNNLRRGLTQSCGCFRHERQVESNTTHGMSGTHLWHTWVKIRERCSDPQDISYCYYGARGISVCEEWMEFMPFYTWAISNGYNNELTIDRIDVNGNYCPENCRWETMIVQQNNRRNNIRFLFNGQMLTIPEICRSFGFPKISHRVIWQKIHRDGLSINDAVLTYKEYIEQVIVKA